MNKPFIRTSSDGTTRIDCHRIPECNICPFKDECWYWKEVNKT
jgi:adenine-specific DNA glycosylase